MEPCTRRSLWINTWKIIRCFFFLIKQTTTQHKTKQDKHTKLNILCQKNEKKTNIYNTLPPEIKKENFIDRFNKAKKYQNKIKINKMFLFFLVFIVNAALVPLLIFSIIIFFPLIYFFLHKRGKLIIILISFFFSCYYNYYLLVIIVVKNKRQEIRTTTKIKTTTTT